MERAVVTPPKFTGNGRSASTQPRRVNRNRTAPRARRPRRRAPPRPARRAACPVRRHRPHAAPRALALSPPATPPTGGSSTLRRLRAVSSAVLSAVSSATLRPRARVWSAASASPRGVLSAPCWRVASQPLGGSEEAVWEESAAPCGGEKHGSACLMKSKPLPPRHGPRLSAASHANPPLRTPLPRNRPRAAPRPPRRPWMSSFRRLAARALIHTGPRQGAVHTGVRHRTVRRASCRAVGRVGLASCRAPPVPRARFRHSSRWSRLRPTRRCRMHRPLRTSRRWVRRRRRRRWPASERLLSDFRATSARLPRGFRLPRRRTRRWRPAATPRVRRHS